MFAKRRSPYGTGGTTGGYPCYPIDTGQTTDYTPAGRTCVDDSAQTQDDRGTYTVLTTGQYSGTTNVTVNSKTDVKSNNTVIDQNTGLEWTRYPSASVGPASDGNLYWDDTGGSNEDIYAYCDAANSASLAGYSDWRVPNFFEIATLVDYEGTTPDSTAFPTLSGSVWTSTSDPVTPTTRAIAIAMSGGVASRSLKANIAVYGILVRG